jgi:hypothetical protein
MTPSCLLRRDVHRTVLYKTCEDRIWIYHRGIWSGGNSRTGRLVAHGVCSTLRERCVKLQERRLNYIHQDTFGGAGIVYTRDREKGTCLDEQSDFGMQTVSYEAIISYTLIESKTMPSIA